MRLILIGTTISTEVALNELIKGNAIPELVITNEKMRASMNSDYVDLDPICNKNKIPILETNDINSENIKQNILRIKPDYVLVIGWSQLIKGDLLNLPVKGFIGFHPALLPENRGRGVIPWTIIQKKQHTGSTLFWLDEGVDSGDIFLQTRIPLATDETSTSLIEKHLAALKELLSRAIDCLKMGKEIRIQQSTENVSYCGKRIPDDGLIDWNKTADDIWTLIRASTKPYPGAFTFYKRYRLIIWEADYIGGAPYSGIAGQVQEITEKGALITCGDGKYILATTVEINNQGPMHPQGILKKHCRLGLNLLSFVSEENAENKK